MKKPLLILWLFGLLVMCVPLSFAINLDANTFAGREEFKMLIIICTPVAFLFLGFLSWIAYKFMKKRGNPKAVKNAMRIFSVLVLGIIAVSSPTSSKKMKDRQRFLFMHEFRDGFLSSCNKSGKEKLKPAMVEMQMDSIDQKIDEYCHCAYYRIDMDNELVDKMMDPKYSNEEIMSSPKYLSIIQECQNELLGWKK